ncbi:carboxymuconolactone decarboxylase family protein [Pedobacter caeni]|uniref:Alkylhydroperoxidase AhpD family core domain-containing protein n=1 Tax=Pedobacter caeni TaxID=288992 RepID=A0A1M4VQI1_9SPHI|nr:carboxymuconolactone decarboxylase family protein [Pedobacter caeni]SHE71188.1 alkylhydroperoxidase AhpD family core domain-containing protein [Pedobacter caeni]
MKQRIDIQKVNPKAYQGMFALENVLNDSSLSKTHKELIKIRASQINGCAFCLDMHTRDARGYGETEQRLYTLSAWRETSFFTEEEMAILALTEEVTLIASGGVSEQTYARAAELFSEQELSEIIMAIVTINAWNRIAVSTHKQPAFVKA